MIDHPVKTEVEKLIELTLFEVNSIMSIMTSLGRLLNKTVLQGIYDLQGAYKRPLKLDTRTFLKERPTALTKFMENLTGVSIDDDEIDPRKLNTFFFCAKSI